MSRVVARLRVHAKADDGFSLTELLVTIMIMGIVMTIVGSMFINVARITANSNSTTTKSSVAANLMDAMSKVIRTAANNPVSGQEIPDPAVVAATANSLTLYSFVDTSALAPKPTKVRLSIDAKGNVVEERWAASTSAQGYWTFPGSPTVRTLGGPVITTSTSLFTYLDASNTVITAGTAGMSATDRKRVASIRVTITIANSLTTGDDAIVIDNTIGMPNLGLPGKAD